MKNERVRESMTPAPTTVEASEDVVEAARRMAAQDVGSLPVVADGELVGMVTDRDLAVRGLAEGKGPDTLVEELMSVEPVGADENDEVETVREVMIRERIRRVPVLGKERRVVGIVAQADLAREDAAASDREVGRIVEAISEPEPNN